DSHGRPTALELQARLVGFCRPTGAHPSSSLMVAAWLRELLHEDIEPYESYSSGPSMTPLPKSVKTSFGALERSHRKKERKGNWRVSVALLAVLAVAGLVVGANGVFDHRQPVAAPVHHPQASTMASSDAAIRAYIDEAQRNFDDKRYNLADELLA